MDTYTQPGGNTPQSLQLSDLMDTIAKLKGQVSPDTYSALEGAGKAAQSAATATSQFPTFISQQKAGYEQQAGIPQGIKTFSDLSDLHKMIIADYQLANKYADKYMRPDFQQSGTPTQQPSDVPTMPNVPAPQLPIMTQESVTQPYSGLTNPWDALNVATTGTALQEKGVVDIANALATLIGQNYQNIWGNLSSDKTAYQANIDAMDRLANMYMNLAQFSQSNKEQGLIAQMQTDVSLAPNTRKALDALRLKYQPLGITAEDLLKEWKRQGKISDTDFSKIVNEWGLPQSLLPKQKIQTVTNKDGTKSIYELQPDDTYRLVSIIGEGGKGQKPVKIGNDWYQYNANTKQYEPINKGLFGTGLFAPPPIPDVSASLSEGTRGVTLDSLIEK